MYKRDEFVHSDLLRDSPGPRRYLFPCWCDRGKSIFSSVCVGETEERENTKRSALLCEQSIKGYIFFNIVSKIILFFLILEKFESLGKVVFSAYALFCDYRIILMGETIQTDTQHDSLWQQQAFFFQKCNRHIQDTHLVFLSTPFASLTSTFLTSLLWQNMSFLLKCLASVNPTSGVELSLEKCL